MKEARYTVAVIAGDGIGTEVTPAAMRCVDALADYHGFGVTWSDLPWGSDYYRKNGRMMPVDGLEQLEAYDTILLGAVGDPEIPDTETLWGLLIPIRRTFDQYVNLRPIRALPGITSPVVGGEEINVVVVRENVEGEYSEIGGRTFHGEEREMVIQETVFTRQGVSRIARYAAELAQSRSNHLTSATKSNGIIHTMPFWDEVVAETLADYPDVVLDKQFIDALVARLLSRPKEFDVIVASNLFGDILSDLTAGIAGSLGVAPSANLNPEGIHPSMFEPVHGSAPDIAGKGIANPIGQMWSASLMLDHVGESDAAAHLVDGFESVVREGNMTPDLRGTLTTDAFTTLVVEKCTNPT